MARKSGKLFSVGIYPVDVAENEHQSLSIKGNLKTEVGYVSQVVFNDICNNQPKNMQYLLLLCI